MKLTKKEFEEKIRYEINYYLDEFTLYGKEEVKTDFVIDRLRRVRDKIFGEKPKVEK